MDNKKRIQLEAFGFGLAILIPFLVMMHVMPHRIGFLKFVVSLIAIFWVISNFGRLKILYFIGLGVIYFTAWKGGIHGLSLVFTLLALAILGISLKDIRLMEPVYTFWMKLVHPIGALVSGLIFAVIFYCIFGFVGILLRLLKKDLLDRGLDPGAKSYWKLREIREFNKENYTKQY